MGLPVITDSVQSYLAEVNRFALLSAEEEKAVAERYYRTKSIGDAHTLVTSNLRYVVKIALEFRNYGCRIADLIQEGNIGLMVAVKKFNPSKGFRLITYATWWIKSCIQEFILKTRGLVKRGTKALKKKLFYRNDSFAQADGKAIEANDPFAPDDYGYDLSLNSSISDETLTHLDMLKDTRPEPVEIAAEKEEKALVRHEVKGALALLNEKERMVIEQRVMAEEPESLQGLGDKLGLTRERVRQIESQALKKLQRSLTGKLALPEPA